MLVHGDGAWTDTSRRESLGDGTMMGDGLPEDASKNQNTAQGKDVTAEDLLKSKVQGITEDKIEEMVDAAIKSMGMSRDDFVNMIRSGMDNIKDDPPSKLEAVIGRRLPIIAVLSIMFLVCIYLGRTEAAGTILCMIGILVHGYFGDIQTEKKAILALK